MNTSQQSSLQKISQRVNFDRVERKLYGHDIAAMPSLVKPLIGETIPDAVIQPKSEAEIIALTRWARQNHIPLTPRGKATSGYGGVIPVKKGVVVDFYFMKSLLSVDKEDLTIVVQPGISWEQLDRQLGDLERDDERHEPARHHNRGLNRRQSQRPDLVQDGHARH